MLQLPHAFAFGALVLAAFLAGSIPFGWVIVRFRKGIDLRTVGSGNPGATNAARVLGKQWFIIITLLDALKGTLPCLAMMAWYTTVIHPEMPLYSPGWSALTAGVAAILGHTFTPWLRFRGGKGVATTLGVFWLLAPITVTACVLLFILLLAVFRYISLGSICAASLLPVGVIFEKQPFARLGQDLVFLLLTAAVALFIIIKHRSNIVRLARGIEPKFGARPPSTNPGQDG